MSSLNRVIAAESNFQDYWKWANELQTIGWIRNRSFDGRESVDEFVAREMGEVWGCIAAFVFLSPKHILYKLGHDLGIF